jgi:hypothetical protein
MPLCASTAAGRRRWSLVGFIPSDLHAGTGDYYLLVVLVRRGHDENHDDQCCVIGHDHVVAIWLQVVKWLR